MEQIIQAFEKKALGRERDSGNWVREFVKINEWVFKIFILGFIQDLL